MRGVVSEALRRRVFLRDGHRCVYCGAVFGSLPALARAIDHVTPTDWFSRGVVSGQPDAPANLVACCVFCNSSKRDMDLEVFSFYLRRAFGRDTRAMTTRVRAALRRTLPEDPGVAPHDDGAPR